MRVLMLMGVLAAGCYDVDELSKSFDMDGTQPGADMSQLPGDMAGSDGTVIDTGEWKELASPTTRALRGVFGDGTGEVFAVGPSSTIVRMAVTHPAELEIADPGYALRGVWAAAGNAITVGDESTVLTRNTGTWVGNTGVVSDITLISIAALNANESIAVGSGGTIAHRTGTDWVTEDSGVSLRLNGVWARSATDVIAVGENGTIIRGSGTGTLTWVDDGSPAKGDLNAVWATGADTYAVGVGGLVLRNTSTGWTAETSNTTEDLWGVFGAGDQVWAVGTNGTIIMRSNGTWTVERSGGPDLRAIWASGPSDAWAVGDNGKILRRAP
jgi:hypothetical protein